jgi:hypothetical protein
MAADEKKVLKDPRFPAWHQRNLEPEIPKPVLPKVPPK